MSPSRRTLLAAAGASLAALESAGAEPYSTDEGSPHDVALLLNVSAHANDALMHGDVELYRELVPMAHDFTLMSPFGGKPSKGRTTDAQWEGMRTFFRNGRLSMELVHANAVKDMVVLAVIERARGLEVGALPAQDWSLRVTLVYRRESARWVLAHRHADPLGPGISVAEAARLARAG
jgi:ketosteroid isomerase-like protein